MAQCDAICSTSTRELQQRHEPVWTDTPYQNKKELKFQRLKQTIEQSYWNNYIKHNQTFYSGVSASIDRPSSEEACPVLLQVLATMELWVVTWQEIGRTCTVARLLHSSWFADRRPSFRMSTASLIHCILADKTQYDLFRHSQGHCLKHAKT